MQDVVNQIKEVLETAPAGTPLKARTALIVRRLISTMNPVVALPISTLLVPKLQQADEADIREALQTTQELIGCLLDRPAPICLRECSVKATCEDCEERHKAPGDLLTEADI